ncbi:MAG TPA: hypothetical protein PKV98_07890 [Burkholderiaceae bacterium]|nr:hypothetical protein [Burkholderiaceae bacterium]
MTQAITQSVIIASYGSSGHALDPASLIFFNLPHDCECPAGYLEVARTEVTFTPDPRPDLVAREVSMLRKKIDETRAEAELKARQLEDRIQNLLALTYEEAPR